MFKKKKRQEPVTLIYHTNVDYPNSTFIKDNLGNYYYLTNNKLYKIVSERVLQSWSPPAIALSHSSNLEKYQSGGRLGFRNGSLLRNISSGAYYIVSDNKCRWLVNPDIFDYLGYSTYDAIVVSNEEILLHELGDKLL